MSSHREAPEISKDPVADSTDLYAFVSTNAAEAGTVTIIANYVPLEGPAAGPNFYEFGEGVVYEINIDNNGDGVPEIIYQFQFDVTIVDPNTFLYNTGPITNSGGMGKPVYQNLNRIQTYTVTKVVNGASTVLARNLPCPPCNIGPLSTPDYAALAAPAVQTLTDRTTGHGLTVFAGQRAEGFYVDLGAIFDLGNIRPFQNYNAFGHLTAMPSIDVLDQLNVHSIAIQVPIEDLTANGSVPHSVDNRNAVIGVYTSASRPKVMIRGAGSEADVVSGPIMQVSRLGNPLFNEVLVPMARKDSWNKLPPTSDDQFVQGVGNPELARLLPAIYPALFPNLGAWNTAHPNGDRGDLVAILLTGLPAGIIPGFQNLSGSGAVQADLLRLNVAVAPSTSPSNLGLLGGDLAGFPNGRRVFDDVASIELKAIAGATLPLVAPSFKPDGAVSVLDDGLTSSGTDTTAKGTEFYLTQFPYLGVPHSGYNAGTPAALQGQ